VAPVIRAVDVSKRFSLHHEKSLKERLLSGRRNADKIEEFWALRHVEFELDAGKTLGLIGANGSGKSTLLKLIGGILTPTEGYVERRGRLAALLELGAGFHTDLTGRENVYLNASILGLSRKQTDEYFDDIVDFSGIEPFIDTQVKFYSSGMYVRLAFAVAVHIDPEVLLVDEVLAVGDEPFQRKCLERIKQFQREGRTIVFVTHGLELVRQLCDRVIMLEKGVVKVDGSPIAALRAFRDTYQEELVPVEETGTRQVEVTKVAITNETGQPKDRFKPGDAMAVQLDVVANQPTDDWECGIAIYNHLDVMVFGTNTRMQSIKLPPITGPRRMIIAIDEIPMLEGQYAVTVALHNNDEKIQYHRLERTVAFRVFDEGNAAGMLHMNASFTLE
jgi:ABC-2 type transport system ATP-binding protein